MKITELVLEVRNNRIFSEYQDYFKKNPTEIKDLVQLVENQSEYPLQEYASWIMVHIAKSKNKELQNYYNECIDMLFTNENQSVRRNNLNVINHLEITDYKESEFIDLLISFIQDYENKVATQVYSMFILSKFVLKYPEIKTEIIEIIDLHSEKKTPAYSSARRKFLRLTKKV